MENRLRIIRDKIKDEKGASPRTVVMAKPLEGYVYSTLAVTLMRTPGQELNLASGFCFTEGLVNCRADLASVGYCRDIESNRVNIVRSGGKTLPSVSSRTMSSRSSCGICGSIIIDELEAMLTPLDDGITIAPQQLSFLMKELKDRQKIFKDIGCTHGAMIASLDVKILSFAEDVGRHNALDKAIGSVLMSNKLELAATALVSSRLSFEMVQKAARAGVYILAGVSAPTSMAIEIADRFNLTLVGFLRGCDMTVYTHPQRIRQRN